MLDFLGDLNGKRPLVQITYRHLIAKSSTRCGGQVFGTNSGLNGQFVVF